MVFSGIGVSHCSPMWLLRTSFFNSRPPTFRTHYTKQSISSLLLSGKSGDRVSIEGWVRTVRPQKQNIFVEVNDGSCLKNIHIVDSANLCSSLERGCCISVCGTLVEVTGRKQAKEIYLDNTASVSLLGGCDQTYPIHKQGLPVEYLREHAHLRPRTNLFSSMLRVRNKATMSIHNFFQEREFIHIHTPILTSNDCEGAGELFRVTHTLEESKNSPKTEPPNRDNFFDVDNTYLSVSGQLQAEIFASAISKVYTFGPTFRAEKSATPRHLSEFWMVEPEVAFYTTEDCMRLASSLVCRVISELFKTLPEEMENFHSWIDDNHDLKKLLLPFLSEQSEFQRISYSDAVKILQTKKYLITWGSDLQREHERFICENYFGGKPVFVTDWPKQIKPFYMKENPDKMTVSNFDLLVPFVGEIIGGSAREDQLNILEERMNELKMNTKSYGWYLDLRRYGSAPHAGFGLGFERLLQLATGMKNIKDVIPIPRYPGYCKF